MAHLKLNTAKWLQLGKKLGYIKKAQEESKQDLMDRLMAEQTGVPAESRSVARKLREEGLSKEAIDGYEKILQKTDLPSSDAEELVYHMDKLGDKWNHVHCAEKMLKYDYTVYQAAHTGVKGPSGRMSGPMMIVEFERILGTDKDMSPDKAASLTRQLHDENYRSDDREQIIDIMDKHGLDIEDAKKLSHEMNQKKSREWQAHLKSKGF